VVKYTWLYKDIYIVCILLIHVTSKYRTRHAAAGDKVYQLLELPMVGGSLRVLRLLPPLKVVAMIYKNVHVAEILLKVALNTINQSINQLKYQNHHIVTESEKKRKYF